MRMRRSPGKLIPIILMLSFLLRSPPSARSTPSQSLVDANTAFALDLYGQLKTRPGNLFFSPYSISTALAMTYAGATGNTEKQMAGVLRFEDPQKVHSEFGELQRKLNEASPHEGIELSVANSLWAQRGHPFLP